MTGNQKEEYFSLWENNFYDIYVNNPDLGSEDFQSIAIGFFIGCGLNLSDSFIMYRYCISKGKY